MSFYEKILDKKAKGDCYVVAELGSNWKTHQDLIDSVVKAKQSGCDAIKFQCFTRNELYGPNYEISKAFPLAQLREKADAVGIDMLCSAFSVEGVEEVNKFVDAHKIASSEMSHLRLLEAVKATGKPLVLSTGGYFLTDIARVLNFLGNHETVVMHCNVAYPTKFVDIKKYAGIRRLFQGPLGYSDHTTSIDAVPMVFQGLGACVYEKHFNPFNYTDTPDATCSISCEEMKILTEVLKGHDVSFTEENEARLMHVRRIIAIRGISPGEVLREGYNMGIFRSKKPDANGVNPFAIGSLEGKRSIKTIATGDGISLTDAV